jgi:2-keto-4-pentenoate hydratase/2-oxohepta-3-ene-1,7-dioic acid hydratase in catechol pathway
VDAVKLLTFKNSGKATYGALTDGGFIDIGARLGNRYPAIRAVLAADALSELSSLLESLTPDHAAAELEFLPVIVNPAKIVCIGLNYESHRIETGRDRLTPSGYLYPLRRYAGGSPAAARGATGFYVS